jgi:chromosome segregation ATPase
MDDFVLLKKDAIWTVATAALQEVDRQLQAEKTKTTALETKLQEAEAKIATLQAEKEAIRSDLSSLVLRVAALES